MTTAGHRRSQNLRGVLASSVLLVLLCSCGEPDVADPGAASATGDSQILEVSGLGDLVDSSRCPDDGRERNLAPLSALFADVDQWVEVLGMPDSMLIEGPSIVLEVQLDPTSEGDDGRETIVPMEVVVHSSQSSLFDDALADAERLLLGLRPNLEGPRDAPKVVVFAAAVNQRAVAFLGRCATEALTVPYIELFGSGSRTAFDQAIGLTGEDLAETLVRTEVSEDRPMQNFPGFEDDVTAEKRQAADIFVVGVPADLPPDHGICVRTAVDWGACADVAALRDAEGYGLAYYEASSGPVELWLIGPQGDLSSPVERLVSIDDAPARADSWSSSQIMVVDLGGATGSPSISTCTVERPEEIVIAPPACGGTSLETLE